MDLRCIKTSDNTKFQCFNMITKLQNLETHRKARFDAGISV
jgi:hypothetical protein